jgi:penicillin V acylase-like amidase (Ntn superfamily)
MKKISLFLLLCFSGQFIFGCTTFCLNKNGHIVFGRNYDWVTGAGIVNTNQRGYLRHPLKPVPMQP